MATNTHTVNTARPAFRWIRRRAAAALLALAEVGCDLDLENPNAPPEDEVVASIDGLFALAIGMQGQFASSIDDYLTTNSLVTDEWGTQSRALISYIALFTGENLDNSFLVVADPWANSYETIKSANTLLASVGPLGLSSSLTAQFTALAKLFKGMALGMLLQQYEAVPVDVSATGAVPQPRAVVLDTVLVLLEGARADLAGVTDEDIAATGARLLGTGFDFRNTIDAMLARYYLVAGRYEEAIAAAERVDLGVLSVLSFPPPTRNPVENLAFQLRYVGALESFVAEAEPGDQRPAYWVDVSAAPLPANPPDSVLLPLRKYSLPEEPFPVYLPDEMRLIRAEALTRLGRFAEAAALVNEVRTQTTSALDEPVAGLPALPSDALDSETELLAQIARERRYELYMQGLRWEDTRRFGPELTTTPTVLFLPIPQQECINNPARPCG